MRRVLTVVGMVFAISSGVAVAQLQLPPAVQAAEDSISADKIREHVRVLSSDEYEGRGPGIKGGEMAANYIAKQFASYGLVPAGDNGTFLQNVPLAGVTTDGLATKFSIISHSGSTLDLKFGEDYVTNNQTRTDVADIDAPIVFVGHGIQAPEYKWDDFAGADVRGKILLVVVNEPPSQDEEFFKGKALTYYGRWTYKYEQAARMGAVGVLIIHRTDLASYPWEVVRNSWSGEKSYLRDDPNAKLKAASWIQVEVARKLFAASGMDVDKEIAAAGQRGFKPVELQSRLKAHIVSKVRNFNSPNVIGMLPRESKSHGPDQAVMYTAHYDHFGIDPKLPSNGKGDNIYHGAADNATGCAIVMELARVYGQMKMAPRHSFIFASVTAEEQGLLGSEYLGMHPPVPASQISLDLNYDDLPPIGDATSTEVAGAERTTFYPTVEKTARAFQFQIEPDPFPMAGSYYRSDHFSLARVGIPAFSIGEGVMYAGHSKEWGIEQEKRYTAERYHKPADRYTPDMDFTGDAKMARFGLVLGWEASSAPSLVQWQAGDEFEKARKQKNTGN